MAHELTHVINRDVMVMTLASFFASLASMIAQFGFFFGGGSAAATTRTTAHIVVVLARLGRSSMSSRFLLLQALSRYREFAADRGSAVLTGPPERARLGAVEDQRHMERIPTQDLRAAEQMTRSSSSRARQEVAMNLFATTRRSRSASPRSSASSPSCRAARPAAASGHGASSTLSRARARSRARRPTGCSR